MQKHLRILAFSALTAAIAAPVVAQDDTALTADTVIATVNGEDIKLGHMIAARATLGERYNQMPAEQLWNGIVEQLIQQTALAQGIESLSAGEAMALENQERSLKAAKAIEIGLEQAVTEEDIQAAYDAEFGNLDPEEEFNASHILVATEEEAIAVKEAIDGGANFAATAREKSTGPSGPNGGELGWFSTGMMVPSFEAATIALEVGEVSDPVETQFGWHVITLNDTRQKNIPTLEEAREGIEARLAQDAALGIIQNAAAGAAIEVTPFENADERFDLINRFDLLE
ncbi:peptidylprolyl isomerase [Roseobacter denitrificans]|uniref:Parvulin-like PPIase n=1 Tax=Roseobacter denitrificans (strain ATCC 33942 / OCh 114) TaxID=375451 RepID=Q16D41_ROSDO|nr:peptidylprolyl isomerase [Roseobacter denitrificans]ABG30102.1 PPIC-type PPIASE domain protein [Roseobacter denitrificans OCh 114]AVL53296.1 peptidylprolyl isomerase [Roseobacter denitrificans]SFF69594.1 peptidyl-prolyl cis-trans isomerase C [Roseobacter denitrificans OCh 114]